MYLDRLWMRVCKHVFMYACHKIRFLRFTCHPDSCTSFVNIYITILPPLSNWTSSIGRELSPVAAIVGGILAAEALKALSVRTWRKFPARIYIDACVYVSMCACRCVCVHVCVCMWIYIYVCVCLQVGLLMTRSYLYDVNTHSYSFLSLSLRFSPSLLPFASLFVCIIV